MDIYLSGAKTHDSEIRLARFLIHQLKEGDLFLDIGAHIGFFSLLASKLVTHGQVISIEASVKTFSVLKQNVVSFNNITALNIAISDTNGSLEFIEFPVMYSEFNTLEKRQYDEEEWFKKIPHKINIVKTINGSDFIASLNHPPNMIKIDVEGAEEKVICGLLKFLGSHQVILIMEFAHPMRGNVNHQLAEKHLIGMGYYPHCIDLSGEQKEIKMATNDFIIQSGLESDNIVYKKKG